MIRFMRYWWVYFLLSACVLVPGIYTLVTSGLKPAIDFTGGTLLEFKVQSSSIRKAQDKKFKVEEENFKKIIENEKLEVSSIQSSGNSSYILKLKPISNDQKTRLMSKINEKYPDTAEIRYENVGPILGKELMQKTLVAATIAIIAICLYVAWAFKNIRFGVSAVLALVHDVLVVGSVFALLGKIKGVEVDTLFVTAVLTTMSFSVHDTIIVFDRIREYQKKNASLSFTQLIDQALTETVGRSLNNSLTIIFMLLALFLLGGETIRWFILALLVGTISGAYSSPFIATPILYLWHEVRDKKH